MYPKGYEYYFGSYDYYYTFTNGILINACMWKVNSYQSIPLIQIIRNTDTEWIIKVISVYTSEVNGSTASGIGINTKITIYYI